MNFVQEITIITHYATEGGIIIIQCPIWVAVIWPLRSPRAPIWTVIMVLIILEGGGTNGFMSVRATMDAMAVSFEYKYNRGPPRVIELFYLVEVADLPVAFW